MRYNDSVAIVDDIPLLSQWIKKFDKSKLVEFFGGRGWIRTTEAKKQQIYSLTPLATRELSHIKLELVDGLEPPTC